jgi:hypothetical protein
MAVGGGLVFLEPTGRFASPYYVYNFFVPLSIYAILRLRLDVPGLLDTDSFMGTTKENSIFCIFCAFLVSKYRKAVVIDQFVQDLILYLKMALLVLTYHIDMRIFVWFLIIYFGKVRI